MTNQQLREIRGTTISDETIRRRLKELNLKTRVPANGQKLLRAHRVARLIFSRDRAQCDKGQ